MDAMRDSDAPAIYLLHRFHQKVMRDTWRRVFYHASMIER